MVAAIAQW